MSLLDSEEDIVHNTEMEFDVTREYLIDVMGYNWTYNPTWNLDVYRKEFLGGAYVKIRRYRNEEQNPENMHVWFAEYSKLGAKKYNSIVYKIKDIYAIYKEIQEAYLKIGRE